MAASNFIGGVMVKPDGANGSGDHELATDSAGNEIGKLFIGGLSQQTTSENLRNYFIKFGELEEATVMMDHRTNRSRGFGYVKYKSEDIVDVVLSSKPHIVDGKEVDAKRCNVNMKGKNRRSLKVFVGGIAPEHSEDTVRAFFQQHGNVTDVNLMMDQNKQRHRGFAFVGFDEEQTVKRLISMHFLNLNGKQVEVKAMEPPNYGKRGPPPGGPGGMMGGVGAPVGGGRGRGGRGAGLPWGAGAPGWGGQNSWNNWGQGAGGWDQNGWGQWNGQGAAATGWDQAGAGAWGAQGSWGGQPAASGGAASGWGAAATTGWDATHAAWSASQQGNFGAYATGAGDYGRGTAVNQHGYHPYKRQ